jgi:hypothetical protein
MQRFSAAALLVLFSLSLIAAPFSADPESQLPECCRRSGAHHCAMSQGAVQGPMSGPTATTVAMKCPYYPASVAVSAERVTPLVAGSLLILAICALYIARRTRTEFRYRFDFNQSQSMRGPPLVLF